MDRTVTRYSDIALENLSEGVFLVDGLGQIVYCNSQLSLMLSVKEETLIGSAYNTLFREIAELSRDPQKTQRELELALRNFDQRPVMYPLMRHLPNGRFQVRIHDRALVKIAQRQFQFPLCFLRIAAQFGNLS